MLWLQVYGGVSAVSMIVLAWLFHSAPLFDENERPIASAAIPAFAGARGLGRTSGRPPSQPRSFRLTREVRSFRLAR
jgi:hypothetical protein